MTKASPDEKAGLIEMLGEQLVNIEIGGKKYSCRAPHVSDTARFGGIIKAELMEDVYTRAERVLDTLRDRGIDDKICVNQYMDILSKAEVDELKLLSSIKSIRGVRFLFLACAKGHHPELNEKAVKKLVTEENWIDILRRLDDISRPRAAKNADGGETPGQ